MQQQVGLKCPTDSVSVLDIRTRPASMKFFLRVHTQYQAGAKKCDECCCLQLVCRVLDESSDLLWRFSPPSFHEIGPAIAKIGCVKLANSIVIQAGALADGSSAGLVPDHSQGELKLVALIRISVVSKAHLFPFMLVLYHIQHINTV